MCSKAPCTFLRKSTFARIAENTQKAPRTSPKQSESASQDLSSQSDSVSDTISSESSNEKQKLLNPIERSEIGGNDEDLEPIEEYYLKEIEETVHADFIRRVSKEEGRIQQQIEEVKRQCDCTEKRCKLQHLKSQLQLRVRQRSRLAFDEISLLNKMEVEQMLSDPGTFEETDRMTEVGKRPSSNPRDDDKPLSPLEV